MIKNINHAALSTPDMDRLLHFYRDLLGARIVFETSWPVGTQMLDDITRLKGSSARVVMIAFGETQIELFQFATPPPAPVDLKRPVCDHGITHLCFNVTDIDGEYKRLVATGVDFHCPPQQVSPGVRTTYGRDPDGNVFELLEVQSEVTLNDLEISA